MPICRARRPSRHSASSDLFADFSTKLATATEKYAAQVAAQAVAQAATAACDEAMAALVLAGGDIIKQVRIKATTAGPGVYELAQIPAPAIPSPRPAPSAPTNFKVELFVDGSLKPELDPAGFTGGKQILAVKSHARGDIGCQVMKTDQGIVQQGS